MITSDDVQLVRLLSEERSIAAVAKRLNLTPSAVSQRLSSLEDRTGLALAERNYRSGITLTTDGAFIAERAADVLVELEVLQDELYERRGVIGGLVRVIAPFGFGRNHIAPMLGAFRKAHPELSVDLRLTDDLVSTPSDPWDILIRVAPLRDSSLVCRILAQNRRLVCASPDYVRQHGAPKLPEDLAHHQCIAISEDGARSSYWSFYSESEGEISIRLQPCLTTNDGETALDWAIAGLGIVMRSEWNAEAAIASGDLVELTLPGWSAPEAPIIALTTKRLARSQRISALIDYLAEQVEVEH